MKAAYRVRVLARIFAYHGELSFHSVRKECDPSWTDQFIAEQCELAGHPVWDTAPAHVKKL